ncbi:MAG: EVE domain-containing protein [Agriterribacter sp.]
MNTTKYWIAAISKEHTMKGVAGGFIQVCHGKQAPLKRMKKGDYLLIYSSKITMEGMEKCQAFTAVGQVKDDEVYQFEMSANFHPHRRNIEFLKCNEVSIIPLINDLEFISNKKSWGYPFRFGFFEINEKDFTLITAAMLKNETQVTGSMY